MARELGLRRASRRFARERGCGWDGASSDSSVFWGAAHDRIGGPVLNAIRRPVSGEAWAIRQSNGGTARARRASLYRPIAEAA